jgi:hypothetical protein
LGQEQLAQALSGIIDCRRRTLQIARARQANQPVPQILPLEKDEDDENDNNAGGLQRMNEWRNQGCERLQSACVGLPDFNGYWPVGRF